VVAAFAAYWNALTVPFVFDDSNAIIVNPSIRHLWPLTAVLHPPGTHAETVGGRPILNLTLALNYALGGLDVRTYHVFNVAVHALVALALLALVQLTLRQRALRRRFGDDALPLAFAVALLWVVHPLQTECVTYIVQRAESMCALCYLLTIYGVGRAAEPGAPARWSALAVGACLVGMATKEVMVTAPLVALLYDRTFVAGSFREAWHARRRLYLALAATWILLFALVLDAARQRGHSDFQGITVPAYLLTQVGALVHYLRLAIWPHPLVFDYGNATVQSPLAVLPQAVVLAALLAGTAVALRRWPALGFVGAWFFVILGPTSSLLPVATQTIAERRMYLPVAAPLALAAAGLYALGGRRALAFVGVWAVALGIVTARRNEDYRTAVGLWTDTVAKRADNPRAHLNLGVALFDADRPGDARAQYEEALRLKPGYTEAHDDLAVTLVALGDPDDAIPHFEAALRIRPDFASAHYNYAQALAGMNRLDDAVAQYEEALRIQPDYVEAHNGLGRVLVLAGRAADAEPHFRDAIRLAPDYAPAFNNLANVLVMLGRPAEAVASYEHVLRLDPSYAEAHFNLATTLAGLGRDDAALPHFEATVRLQPDDAEAHYALGATLARLGRRAEARSQYEDALRIRPGYADVRRALDAL
jgi:tetratricopeptide (TPR) repeat protein